MWKELTSILSNLNNFHSLEVVDRVSETQLQVGENSNWIIWRLKGWWSVDKDKCITLSLSPGGHDLPKLDGDAYSVYISTYSTLSVQAVLTNTKCTLLILYITGQDERSVIRGRCEVTAEIPVFVFHWQVLDHNWILGLVQRDAENKQASVIFCEFNPLTAGAAYIWLFIFLLAQ